MELALAVIILLALIVCWFVLPAEKSSGAHAHAHAKPMPQASQRA